MCRQGHSDTQAPCAWGCNPSGPTCQLAFLALVSCKSSEIEGELVALWVGGSCLYVLLQHLVTREPELVGSSISVPLEELVASTDPRAWEVPAGVPNLLEIYQGSLRRRVERCLFCPLKLHLPVRSCLWGQIISHSFPEMYERGTVQGRGGGRE